MEKEIPKHREWLTYGEAQEISGLSRITLWRATKGNLPLPYTLPVYKVGKAVRFRREDLRKYMEARITSIHCGPYGCDGPVEDEGDENEWREDDCDPDGYLVKEK